MKKNVRSKNIIMLRDIKAFQKDKEKYVIQLSQIYDIYEFNDDELDFNINRMIKKTSKMIGNQIFNVRFLSQMIKFRINKNSEVYERNIIDFIFTLIILSIFIKSGIKIQDEDVPDVEIMNASVYIKCMNNIIIKHKDQFTYYQICEYMEDMKYHMNTVCRVIGDKLGIGFSAFDVIEVMRKDEGMREILMTRFDTPDTIKPNEFENLINSKYTELKDYITTEMEGSNLAILLDANLINKGQGRELFVHMGLKPDLDGHTQTITSNTNLLNGLKDPVAYFIDGQGSRKAETLKLKVSRQIPDCSL